MIAVCVEAFDPFFDSLRFQLAVDVRQRQHLVTGVLNGTGFVGTDMSCICGDDAFVVLQQGRDDDGIRLRAADEEFDVRVRALACRADLFFRALAVLVCPVPGQLLEVRVRERL